IFLKFWKPRNEWHFGQHDKELRRQGDKQPDNPTGRQGDKETGEDPALTLWRVGVAWAPYALMSLLLLLTGLVRQKEQHGPVHLGPLRTKYAIEIYALHDQSHRDPSLVPPGSAPKAEK